jgi:S-adenosylmethionine synthetase
MRARAPWRALEICEHNGIGHPDTLTDGACEAAAVALARAYREAFGRVLHFNVDKGLLIVAVEELIEELAKGTIAVY